MQSNRFKRVPTLIAVLVFLSLIYAPATLLAAGVKSSVGLGAALVPDYEGSEDATAAPALFASFVWEEGYSVKLMGNSLRVNALPSKNFSVGPMLQYRAVRDNDVENDAVARMRKVDSTVAAGLFAGFNQDGWDTRLEWTGDASNDHNGTLTTLRAGYSMQNSGMTTRVGVSTTYADDHYMDAYFSVDPGNAASSGLAVYKAEAGFKDVGVDVSLDYPINESWSVMTILGYKALLGDAKDSPLVDDAGSSNQLNGGVLAIYKF